MEGKKYFFITPQYTITKSDCRIVNYIKVVPFYCSTDNKMWTVVDLNTYLNFGYN